MIQSIKPVKEYVISHAIIGSTTDGAGHSPFATGTPHPWTLLPRESWQQELRLSHDEKGSSYTHGRAELLVTRHETIGEEAVLTKSMINQVLWLIAGTIASDTGEDIESVAKRIKTYI